MKNGKTMLMFAVLLAIASSATSAAEFGTRDQAKAMLHRAVAMLEADKVGLWICSPAVMVAS